MPVQLIFKEKIRNPVGKQVTFKRQNTKEKKQKSSRGLEGLEDCRVTEVNVGRGTPALRVLRESLSLQAFQEVPVSGDTRLSLLEKLARHP